MAAAPLGQSTVVLREATVESENTEGGSFRWSSRARQNLYVSVLGAFAIFVFLVAPTALQFLRKQDELRQAAEQRIL